MSIEKMSHTHPKYVLSLVTVLLLFLTAANAQPCAINTATDVVCLGNSIALSTPLNSGDSAWAWDFDDGKTSTQGPSVVYQYTSSGNFFPKLTVYRTGGTSCTVIRSTPIKVVNKPQAHFIASADTLCFKNNQLCLTDNSILGNAPLSKRIVLFGDGSFDQAINTLPPNVCHSYSNPAGGQYVVVMQVFDTNGCESSHIDSAVVHPRMGSLGYLTVYDPGCNVTPVKYNNTSTIALSTVKSFKWVFGDGTYDSTNWTNFIHVYTGTQVYIPSLIVTDINNCMDTLTRDKAVSDLTSDTSFTITKLGSSCVNANSFSFQSPTKWVANWRIYNPEGKLILNSNMNPAGYTFPNCGRYRLRFSIPTTVCSYTKDTFIDIYGPNTVIQNDTLKVKNGVQCGIHDTVFFNNPFLDLNCYHQNGPMNRLWDFGDPYAPPCTTDTKNGLFVNSNCNFSKDSSGVWHRYKDGKDSCYKVKLVMMDPIRNCRDSDNTILSLMTADAGWDSTVTPVRRGVYITGGKCFGQTVTFMLDQLLPRCNPDRIWILPDSACFPHIWRLKDTTNKGTSYSYTYDTTCSPDGWITYGIIVSNGFNQLGQRCYDTAWYHHKLYIQPLHADFTTSSTPVPGSCSQNTVQFTSTKPVQNNLSRVMWEFGDGDTLGQYFNPGDSVILPVSHTYQSSGSFMARLTVYNRNNCLEGSTQQVYLGRHSSFTINKTLVCNSNPIGLTETVGYYNTHGSILYSNYWYDINRNTNGKELILWDLNDGNGFVQLNKNPLISYSVPGNYSIRMMVRDSMGCTDTITSADTIHMVQLRPHIAIDQTDYLCAPVIILVNDSSTITDSSAALNAQPYDAIDSREWEWDDYKENSTLQTPAHFYTSNGTYNIKLKVTSREGCIAYDSIPITIKGPQPQFVFTGDTAGCIPLTITAKNTSGKSMLNWIWYFNDTNIYSTQNDSNVTFTYHRAGIYHVRLIGEDTVWNPLTQSFKSCTAVFPDSTTNVVKRDVRVIDVPKTEIFTDDNICLGQPFLIATRNLEPYTKFFWELEGDDARTKLAPDSAFIYTFTQTGKKTIRLTATSPSPFFCKDEVTKEVHISEVRAEFEINLISESNYSFVNKSTGAISYEWDFGDERNAAENKSQKESPAHNYRFAPGPHIVCLSAYNQEGCLDSVCKKTPLSGILDIPNVFTPNDDGQNDAFDIYIEGAQNYQLAIYNRWGTKVFESPVDGVGNDGVNWNGKDSNTGPDCPAGTYYYVLKYQLLNSNKEQSSNGTITLLR